MGRRRFAAEFKREAARLAQQPGASRAKVAQELELNANILGRWIRQFKIGKWEVAPGKSLKTEQQLEIERLRRELAKAQTERDILKKAVAYFAKEPK
jgi:transposase